MTRPAAQPNQRQFSNASYLRATVHGCIDISKKLVVAFFVLGVVNSAPGGSQELIAQEFGEPKTSSQLIQEAMNARKQSMSSVEKFRVPQNGEMANPYREATEQQIRNQIDLMKQLNSTMDRTKNERGERISNIRSDIQLLMLELQKINDAKANMTPRINQASSQKMVDSNSVDQNPSPDAQAETTGPKKNGVQSPNSQMSKSIDDSTSANPNASAQNKMTPFEVMANDPVDKLGLANNLVAIGSYQTAIQIFLELSKDRSLDESTKNWVYFQMGRCYLGTDSIPEAKEAFKKSAESVQSDIAQRTSKWWLDQLESQLGIDKSLNEMQETLTKLEAAYGTDK